MNQNKPGHRTANQILYQLTRTAIARNLDKDYLRRDLLKQNFRGLQKELVLLVGSKKALDLMKDRRLI